MHSVSKNVLYKCHLTHATAQSTITTDVRKYLYLRRAVCLREDGKLIVFHKACRLPGTVYHKKNLALRHRGRPAGKLRGYGYQLMNILIAGPFTPHLPNSVLYQVYYLVCR